MHYKWVIVRCDVKHSISSSNFVTLEWRSKKLLALLLYKVFLRRMLPMTCSKLAFSLSYWMHASPYNVGLMVCSVLGLSFAWMSLNPFQLTLLRYFGIQLSFQKYKDKTKWKKWNKKSKHKRYPATILPQKNNDPETQNMIKIKKLLSIGYISYIINPFNTAYADVISVKLKKWLKQQIRV